MKCLINVRAAAAARAGCGRCGLRPVLIRIFYKFFYTSENSSFETITRRRKDFKDLQEWEFD